MILKFDAYYAGEVHFDFPFHDEHDQSINVLN